MYMRNILTCVEVFLFLCLFINARNTNPPYAFISHAITASPLSALLLDTGGGVLLVYSGRALQQLLMNYLPKLKP